MNGKGWEIENQNLSLNSLDYSLKHLKEIIALWWRPIFPPPRLAYFSVDQETQREFSLRIDYWEKAPSTQLTLLHKSRWGGKTVITYSSVQNKESSHMHTYLTEFCLLNNTFRIGIMETINKMVDTMDLSICSDGKFKLAKFHEQKWHCTNTIERKYFDSEPSYLHAHSLFIIL